jgi:hypothetical protein
MKLTVLHAVLLSLFPSALGASAQDAGRTDLRQESLTMLRLRDGSILWGRVLDHDPEAIVYQRADTGGRHRLGFGLLDPVEEKELKARFGYVDLVADELLVPAEVLTTTEGVQYTGVVLQRVGDTLLLKTASATVPVPKARLAGAPTPTMVPAREVYTKDELYAQKLAEVDLGTAAGRVELALWCERTLDFARAVENWSKAAELDPTHRADEVKNGLSRAGEKALRADQIEWLANVDALVARKRFDEALSAAEAFAGKFPDSPLRPDAKRALDRAAKARDRWISERSWSLWNAQVGKVARELSVRATLAEVLAALEGKFKEDVLAGVVKELSKSTKEATSEVVLRAFATRKKERWLRASYGQGTWLLGKDRALKGGSDDEQPKQVPVNERDAERLELEQRLARFIENQQLARSAQAGPGEEDQRETFWAELPSTARQNWILAYYAENGGDFEVAPKPLLSACRECGGTGTRQLTLVGSNPAANAGNQQGGRGGAGATQGAATDTFAECVGCHGIGIVRRISYR